MRDDRDEPDSLIDGVLAGYSNAEPLEGIEDRVLRRIQAASIGRRSVWLQGLRFGIPAVIALLIAVLALRMEWYRQSPVTRTTKVESFSEPQSLTPQPQLRPLESIRPLEPKPGIRSGQGSSNPSRSLPKEECFPARVPTTDEERALLAWVRSSPAEAKQAFAELEERGTEPIEIQPIQIPPLESDGNQ